jgi:diguanylate cyclase (GGDEF)-like protein/PAS domain S-box-containing protein
MNKPIRNDGSKNARSRVFDGDDRFRIIFDAVNDGIFIANPTTGRFVEVNEPGCRMFGYTRVELIDCDIAMLTRGVPPYTDDAAIEWLQKVTSEGPQTLEWHAKTKTGAPFWVEISLRYTEFGKIPAVVAIVRDISERKAADDTLREAHAAFVEAQALAHVGSFTVDLLNNRATWSDECYRILGLDPATDLPSFDAYLARIHPDDRAALTDAYKRSLEDRAPRTLDQRIIRGDGTVRVVQQRWQNYCGADGRPLRTTGTVQDITERKAAETQIRQESNFANALLDNAPGLVVLIDENGRLARWNENLSALTGFSAEQLQGLDAASFVVDSDLNMARTALREAFGGSRMDIEFGVRAKTGDVRTIRWSGRPITSNGHRYLLGAGSDVTDMRKAETLLRAVAVSASEIGITTNLDASIRKAMEIVSTAIRIDRMGVMERPATPDSAPVYRYAWRAPDVTVKIDESFFEKPPIWTPQTAAWQAPLREGKIVTTDSRTATGDVKKMLEFLGTKSVLLIPISVNGEYWGIVGFDSCKQERIWPDVEINILRMLADLIGSAIERERYVKELSDATRIIESSPTILYRLSAAPDMPMIYVSPNVDRLGYDRAELLAEPTFYRTLIHPDDRDRVATDQAQARRGETSATVFEVRFLAADGTYRWFESHRTNIARQDGTLTGIEGEIIDINERKLAEEKLRASEERFRTIFESVNDAIVVVDVATTSLVDCNPRLGEMFGYTREELFSRDLAGLVADVPPYTLADAAARAAAGETIAFEWLCRNKSGHDFWLVGSLRRAHFGGRDVLLATARDETERKRDETALQKSHQIVEAILNTVAARIFWKDKNLIYLGCNDAFARDAGFSQRKDIVGKDDYQMGWRDQADLYRGDDRAVIESGRGKFLIEEPQTSAEGKIITLLTSKVPLRDASDQIVGVLGTYIDITERKQLEEKLIRTARYDFLTDLPNRAVFVEELGRVIARARRDGRSFAVLYLDLDHFKDVNDTLGHPAGDLLLQAVAGRLQATTREVDTVARFGGDEFALINTDIEEPADAVVVADKILKALAEPFTIQHNEIRAGASIGIAVYGQDAPDEETLLSRADVALYRAKADGRGTYRFFTEAMDTEVRSRVQLTSELRNAIASGQLFLMYQPQVDTETNHIIGLEALVRWRHPTRGLVLPGEFIAVAEKSGLIVALGYWVLHEACQQMKAWVDAGIAPPLVAVNVSALQFKSPIELENDIAAILAETALPPGLLELELTESIVMEISRDRSDALLRLRESGVRIAIDDFGTGYSSLEYLGRLPVNRIKIAQNFMPDLSSGSHNATIVRTAIGMAHDLGLDAIVEGVETAEQLELIRSWSGHKVQGFYFSKPLVAGEVAELLRVGKIVPAPSIAPEIPLSGKIGRSASAS